jgi:formylglycine-generating enzyme required for sulfatase activity
MDRVLPNPNEVPPREAMGLSEHFEERLDPRLLASHRDLFALDASALMRELSTASHSAERRIAAGTLLGFLGDPRLCTLRPDMVRLPGGTVILGLAESCVDEVHERWSHVGVQRAWIVKECPAHMTELKPFSIARYPVTNQEYREFLLDTGAHFIPSGWTNGVYPIFAANHPVWTVTPDAADAYVVWLSARTGRKFRLPTESEWEYAASGGGRQEYPWGDQFLPDHANTVETGPLTTTPVGCYPAGFTATGLADMAGNVEEYTASTYAPYPGGTPVTDDLAGMENGYRIARGGSFTRYGDLCRCKRRHGWYRSPIYAMGFRIAESERLEGGNLFSMS